MIIAYADPPYPGSANMYPEKEEVDHKLLIETLCQEYKDGWALSTGGINLRDVILLCPPKVRIGIWVKTFVPFRPGCKVAYAWEALIWNGGRKRPKGKDTFHVRDWVMAMPPVFQKKNIGDIKGQKPMEFCFWMFEILGMATTDILVDLYPGSGAVTMAFEIWKRQGRLPL